MGPGLAAKNYRKAVIEKKDVFRKQRHWLVHKRAVISWEAQTLATSEGHGAPSACPQHEPTLGAQAMCVGAASGKAVPHNKPVPALLQKYLDVHAGV